MTGIESNLVLTLPLAAIVVGGVLAGRRKREPFFDWPEADSAGVQEIDLREIELVDGRLQ